MVEMHMEFKVGKFSGAMVSTRPGPGKIFSW